MKNIIDPQNKSLKLSSLSSADKQIILDIINAELYPKTVKEIKNKVLRTGRKIPEYLITRTLRSLLSEDKVRFKGGRWMNNDAFSQSKTIQTGYSSRIIEFPKLSDTAEQVLPDANRYNPELEDGTWSKFRNLISYYSECLRNEEGADAFSFLDDIGKNYMYATACRPEIELLDHSLAIHIRQTCNESRSHSSPVYRCEHLTTPRLILVKSIACSATSNYSCWLVISFV